MHNAKPIDHFFAYRHFNFAVSFSNFQNFYTQPLAEQILLQNVGNYFTSYYIFL